MMRCTRCGAETAVIDSREAAKAGQFAKRLARRMVPSVADAQSYVMRRRRCTACEQVFHSVEVAIDKG
jgi:transcriptional regulator NrdR family protein